MRGTKQNLEIKKEEAKRRSESMFFVIGILSCFPLPCFVPGCHTFDFKIATAAVRPRNDTELERFWVKIAYFARILRVLRSRQRRRTARSATDAAYPLRVLRNSRPSCCGSQNLCAALTAASNFDRCHSFLLAASATGGARKRPRTHVRRRVQVACLPNIFAVCQTAEKVRNRAK